MNCKPHPPKVTMNIKNIPSSVVKATKFSVSVNLNRYPNLEADSNYTEWTNHSDNIYYLVYMLQFGQVSLHSSINKPKRT